MKRTPAGRPLVLGSPVPLNQDSPLEWWNEAGILLGLSGEELRAQTALADEIIEEIFAEEKEEKCSPP